MANRTSSGLTLVIPRDVTFEGDRALIYLGGDSVGNVEVQLESTLYRGCDVRIGANLVGEELDIDALGDGANAAHAMVCIVGGPFVREGEDGSKKRDNALVDTGPDLGDVQFAIRAELLFDVFV
jgi:hypothetical protein